jgi:TolA-binding protein
LAAISGSGTFTDDCLSAGDPYTEVVAVLAANEVQSALNAAALAAPGVIALVPAIDSPTGIRLGLMVAWGVANAIYLALAQTLAVSVDCAQTAFSNTQESTLSVDPSGSDTVVPTSTQFSIDRLIAKAGDSQTKINAVQTTVNTVKTQTDSVDTAVTALNNILNDITDRVDDVQTGLQTLQTRVAILQNTEVTILKKADTLIANLGSLQTLQLRMEIEDNLDRNEEAPVALFQLPAAFGGYLEVVKSIVIDTLAKEAAVGNPSLKAMAYLAQANAAFTAGTYKTAYALYRKAYGYGR